MTRCCTCAAATLLLLAATSFADPVVLESGFTIRKFATITGPVDVAVAPDGTLYVGNDPPGGSTTEPARIRTISPDGLTVTEIGPLINDPDTVIVDVNGDVAGAGDVLVGSAWGLYGLDPTTGIATQLFGRPPFENTGWMDFDSSGRLFAGTLSGGLVVVEGGVATVLATFGSLAPGSAAVDGSGKLYAGMLSGELYGVPLDGSPPSYVASLGSAIEDLTFGGGAFGGRLFAGDRIGNIVVFDPDTSGLSTFATGFSRATGLAFGPDGNLFIAAGDAIWVVETIPEPPTVALLALSIAALSLVRRRRS